MALDMTGIMEAHRPFMSFPHPARDQRRREAPFPAAAAESSKPKEPRE
jgi:hypothetical protein